MSVLTIEKNNSLNIHPNFSVNDRLVSRSKHQKQFVSTIYLPKEATIKFTNESISIRFVYDIPDLDLTNLNYKTVTLKVGAKTKRIFEIEASFGGNNFKMLLNRFNTILDFINESKQKETSQDVRKSYELINKILEVLPAKLQEFDIETKLFS